MAKYQKGASGNPTGRPKGALNKQTQLIKLLEPHAEALINKMIEMALSGDSMSLRLCIERLLPKITDKPTTACMPDLESNKTAKIIPAAPLGAKLAFCFIKNNLSNKQALTPLFV
jgi:hypothetical protein